MRTLIIFDHPYTAEAHTNEPHNRSFSAALCKRVQECEAANGNEVDLIDLAVDGFDPVMSGEDLANWRRGRPMNDQVSDYQQRLLAADRAVFIFPIWWELMPALTKGFIDKVYAKGILYAQSEDGRTMKTFLKPGFEVVLVTTMGSPKFLYNVVFGKPIEKAIKLGLCKKTGIEHFRWFSFSGVDKLSLEKRQKLIADLSL